MHISIVMLVFFFDLMSIYSNYHPLIEHIRGFQIPLKTIKIKAFLTTLKT
jgi:hypothetical protein